MLQENLEIKSMWHVLSGILQSQVQAEGSIQAQVRMLSVGMDIALSPKGVQKRKAFEKHLRMHRWETRNVTNECLSQLSQAW